MDRAALQERFGIIGTSPAIQHVLDRVRLVARTDISVLVQGESGVGKELIANAVHELSSRRHGALVTVNCGAIPEGLIESELFGAEKGAYTGAVERRSGYFEEADGGTIFLDEIGEMPLQAQVRLLRVLETGTFTRVGASTARRTDARVLAATNKDLGREVEAGRFREDLYYRLSTVVVNVPPLRERREDVLPIFESFLHRFVQQYNAGRKRLDESAHALLQRYDWPGNVRELRNLAEQVVVLHPAETVTADDVRPLLRGVTAQDMPRQLVPVSQATAGADEAEAFRERELIYRALLELRMEVRDLKDQITDLASGGDFAVVSASAPSDGSDDNRYLIVRDPHQNALVPYIEDAAFEIAPLEEPPPPPPSRPSEDEGDASDAVVLPLTDTEGEPAIPTLEEVERRLIAEALKHFDGNRRQTAKALGISERTLYRKLKEIEDA